MEERRATDIYDRGEKALAALAVSIQRQDRIDMPALMALATDIGHSVEKSNHLVVRALEGPIGPSVITNLINVSILASRVGAGLGYYGQDLQRLTLAGLVHDIGLFAVPQSILTKPGRLTKDERSLIEQHPELGYQVIRRLGDEWEWLAEVVRHAHERWNGRGYPNHLKGREINELAQIIGVVDVYDALVTPRPYRRRYFPHEAIRELVVAERAAFPREIVKALLEQLSAYPLGTVVRLTTGELGTVVTINPRYPLRPIVEIKEASLIGDRRESRTLDLSGTPLVSVLETIEPPAVARMPSCSGVSGERRHKAVSSVSVQFASLLEGLDALASTIQSVIDARSSAPSTKERESSGEKRIEEAGRATGKQYSDPSFEKEVIGLFALEAHEWLAQIHSALKRLGEGTADAARPKLYSIILQGLTNLAKSAATVPLTSIEEMAVNLLAALQDVGSSEPKTMSTGLASLQTGIDRIAAALLHAQGVAGSQPTGGDSNIDAIPEQVAEESLAPPSVASQADLEKVSVEVGSGTTLLQAMRDLQRVRSRSIQPARDVLEAVIARATEETGELTAGRMRELLGDLDRIDGEFLQEISRRVPIMIHALTDLRQSGETDFVTASQLDPVIQDVEALQDAAASVQANSITIFLQGLRSFLMVAAYRKEATLPQRLSAVESRLRALVPMAEQWVNIGRVERAAIAEILPLS